MNFIWDLDGTLFDSYAVINRALKETLEKHNIARDPEKAKVYIIRYSVKQYLAETAREEGLEEGVLQDTFNMYHDALTDEITLMPHAKETLEMLSLRGDKHFVATHRTGTAYRILENLGIYGLFTDVITAEDGFKRKPAPDSVNHLIEKHGLKREETWYVGDRSLDIMCAKNAGIGSVLYLPRTNPGEKTGLEDYVAEDLMQIAEMIK